MGGLCLSFVDDVDSGGGKGGGNDVRGVESFAKAEAAGGGTDYRDEGIVDGNLPHGVAGEEFVVEAKPDGADADEQGQINQSRHGDVGQRAVEKHAGGNEQETADGKAVACTHKDIDAFVQTTGEERGTCSAEGVEDNHAIAPKGESSSCTVPDIQYHDAGKAKYASPYLAGRHAVALEKETGKEDNGKDAERIENGRTCSRSVGESDVEAGVVERRAQQGIKQYKAPVAVASGCEALAGKLCHGEDEES